MKKEHPERNDSIVILQPSDHPYIKQPSFIAYRYARFFAMEKVVRYVNEENTLEDDLEDNSLRTVQSGLLISDNTPIEIQERYQEKFKIDD